MGLAIYAILVLTAVDWSLAEKINVQELRCLVCQRTVEEMEKLVDKVDPDKKVVLGSYRLDHEGNLPQRKVELRRSELFLTELMETVCNAMDDYVRVRSKTTGKLLVIPLVINGAMNPIVGQYDIIQDGDLNKSLKFYVFLAKNVPKVLKRLWSKAKHPKVICEAVSSSSPQNLQPGLPFRTHILQRCFLNSPWPTNSLTASLSRDPLK